MCKIYPTSAIFTKLSNSKCLITFECKGEKHHLLIYKEEAPNPNCYRFVHELSCGGITNVSLVKNY